MDLGPRIAVVGAVGLVEAVFATDADVPETPVLTAGAALVGLGSFGLGSGFALELAEFATGFACLTTSGFRGMVGLVIIGEVGFGLVTATFFGAGFSGDFETGGLLMIFGAIDFVLGSGCLEFEVAAGVVFGFPGVAGMSLVGIGKTLDDAVAVGLTLATG